MKIERICLDATFIADLSASIDETGIDDERRAVLRAVRRVASALRQGHVKVVVPAPALAEALSVRGYEGRIALLDQLDGNFPPLDRRAAELAAMRYRAWRSKNPAPKRENDKTRVRVDSFILAVAEISKCDAVVTQDRRFDLMSHGSPVRVLSAEDVADALGLSDDNLAD